MALLLCIEAGTDIGSVALAKNDRLLSLRESCESRQHAQNLAVYVEEILRENDLDAKDLDAVAVGMGPVPTPVCGSACRWPKEFATGPGFR